MISVIYMTLEPGRNDYTKRFNVSLTGGGRRRRKGEEGGGKEVLAESSINILLLLSS